MIFLTGCQPVVFNKEIYSAPAASIVDNNNFPPKADRPLAETVYQNSSMGDQSLYDGFFSHLKPVGDVGVVRGGIVPHHLVAGYIPATFFSYIAKQKPSTIILFSPNHFRRGTSKIISGLMDWQTPYGIAATDKDIISKLKSAGVLKIDEATMNQEHGIFGLMPIIAKTNPQAKVVPIILDWSAPTSSLDALLEKLTPLLPADTVVVASVDFSHYQSWPVANFHDEYTRAVIRNFDFDHLWDTEIDSHPSVYLTMRLMEKFGAQKIANEISNNSAQIMGRPGAKETTSYYSPWFVAPPNKEGGEVSANEHTPAPLFRGETNAASLLFFGDMMLDRNVKKRIDEHGANWIFSELAGQEDRFFMGMNVVHANLEGPFADSRRAIT